MEEKTGKCTKKAFTTKEKVIPMEEPKQQQMRKKGKNKSQTSSKDHLCCELSKYSLNLQNKPTVEHISTLP